MRKHADEMPEATETIGGLNAIVAKNGRTDRRDVKRRVAEQGAVPVTAFGQTAFDHTATRSRIDSSAL